MIRKLGISAAVFVILALVATGCLTIVRGMFVNAFRNNATAWCNESGARQSDTTAVVTVKSEKLNAEQLQNAGHIIAIGQQRKLPARAWQIAIQAAMTESGMRNLDYGDRDSLGMFQMRPSMGWGTPDQVKDPVYAVGKFYDVLEKVPNWQAMRPGDAAQAVERSGFPQRYHKWEEFAKELVAQAGGVVTDQSATQASASCTPAPSGTPGSAVPVTSRDARQLSDWLYASGALTYTTQFCNPEPDIKSGKIAANGLAFLKEMVDAGFKFRLSCAMTGHVPDGLLHPAWRAYDIDMVNGERVGPGHSESEKLIKWLMARPNRQLPYEVGGPLTPGDRGKNAAPGGMRGGPFFTDRNHQGHFHMGFKETTDTPAGGWY